MKDINFCVHLCRYSCILREESTSPAAPAWVINDSNDQHVLIFKLICVLTLDLSLSLSLFL